MSARDRSRHERSGNLVLPILSLAAVATIACGGASGTPLHESGATAAVPVVATAAESGLLELQGAVPAGREAGWYTQRLTAREYEILKLRQERDGVSVFRVRKAGRQYEVRVVVADDNVASSVEIAPIVVDAAAAEMPVAVSAADSGGADAAPASAVGVAEHAADTRAADQVARQAPATAPTGPAAETIPYSRDAEPAVTRAPAPEARVAEPVTAPPAPPLPEPRSYTVRVPTGTLIAARLDNELTSATAEMGDAFAMRVTDAVWVDGVEVLPAGTQVWGYVAEVERAGRPNKGGRLVLATDSVQVGGEALALDALVSSDGERLEGRDSAREDVKEVAIGAGLGGLVGGLLGGKKGVLVGVLAGGGGTFVATKGEEVEIPRDTPLSLELRRDLTITFVDSE